jgi:predicted branched-subunit amino acid permease
MSYGVTDEIFGVSACRKERVTVDYFFALVAISVFGWTFGTLMGVVSGSILPDRIVSALGIALYGMFIAIIIPPAKHNRVIFAAIIITMLASWLFSVIPVIKDISSGFKIIILTIIIAGGAAYLHPVEEEMNV